VIREQLIVHADFKLPAEEPLLTELLALRKTISQDLQLPTSEEPIHVYLYESAERYQEQARKYFPGSTVRRAFFIENATRLNVYAQWGASAAEDLRHELTHGYLHASLRNLPLWLDEGLAEYFEVPANQAGRNQTHVDWLQRLSHEGNWSPDIARLESLTSATAMTQTDYAEAWLWTHWLLTAQPAKQALLQQQLKQLRLEGSAPPLSLKLRAVHSLPHKQVQDHLEHLTADTAKHVSD
jgi:hypothetical protein